MRIIIGLCLGLTLALGACEDPGETATDHGGEAGASADAGGAEGSGGLPDGVYECSYNSGGMLYSLGQVTIDGARYAGFSGGMRGTYSLAADETLEFSNSFEGFPDGYRIDSAAWRISSSSGNRYIEIMFVSPSGNGTVATCQT